MAKIADSVHTFQLAALNFASMIINYFRVVPYDAIDKKNYFTISPCGVSHYTNEMSFTRLPDWEQEYTIFMKLTEVWIILCRLTSHTCIIDLFTNSKF